MLGNHRYDPKSTPRCLSGQILRTLRGRGHFISSESLRTAIRSSCGLFCRGTHVFLCSSNAPLSVTRGRVAHAFSRANRRSPSPLFLGRPKRWALHDIFRKECGSMKETENPKASSPSPPSLGQAVRQSLCLTDRASERAGDRTAGRLPSSPALSFCGSIHVS